MFEHFAIAFAAHASFAAIETAFKYVARKRPDLVAAASAAQNTEQIERIFKEAVGVIIAEAATGRIIVDGAAISALRGVKFDHQHGQVTIGNTQVSAQVLITGGSAGATGKTHIGGNTSLRSQGTSIEVGQGASIVMTGGASIRQT